MRVLGNSQHSLRPILILLAANLICGLFIFRDYGLSWDEPLFYDYAQALGYAYSPNEWFSGTFQLENAFGASGSDHANRGPGYLLLARGPVYLLEGFGLENASAWHLINFLAFQFGVYLFYRLALRWMKPWPALAAAALFAWQPLLWGHSFINPKDPSFLVFFIGSVLFGFEMADRLAEDTATKTRKVLSVLLAAFFLGIATSIRVLAPLAGLIVIIYAFKKFNRKSLLAYLAYGLIAILVMFITWPYLWTNPLSRFFEVFGFMSDNPTHLAVLFGGEIYRAGELPRRYLPTLMALTLTEPVWPLFIVGIMVAVRKTISAYKKRSTDDQPLITAHWSLLIDYCLLLAWFLIPFAYVILRRPSMYDGFRHFLFMLPPVFVFAGLAFEKIFQFLRARAAGIVLTAFILLPGIIASINLHPYEYAYYNSFIGGTDGAFRTYETEYWLTCYKEAMDDFKIQSSEPARLFVHREAYIAAAYAKDRVNVREERGARAEIGSGDYILVNSRSNEDLSTFGDAPVVLEIKRGKATFCVIRRIP